MVQFPGSSALTLPLALTTIHPRQCQILQCFIEREVHARVVTEELPGSLVIHARSSLRRSKRAKPDGTTANSDPGSPVPGNHPKHALVRNTACRVATSVPRIVLTAVSKIGPLIIQPVMILVIDSDISHDQIVRELTMVAVSILPLPVRVQSVLTAGKDSPPVNGHQGVVAIIYLHGIAVADRNKSHVNSLATVAPSGPSASSYA